MQEASTGTILNERRGDTESRVPPFSLSAKNHPLFAQRRRTDLQPKGLPFVSLGRRPCFRPPGDLPSPAPPPLKFEMCEVVVLFTAPGRPVFDASNPLG